MKHRTFSFTDRLYDWLSKDSNGVEEDTYKINKLLLSKGPCMISRFGSTELQTLFYCKYYPLSFPLKKRTFYNIQYASGFFPVSYSNLRKFADLYKNDVKELDLLVSWRIEELFFKDWLLNIPEIKKSSLDSFYLQENPWTNSLRGRHVLVVHPFAETIESQYRNKRELLFANKNVLPEFGSLQTVKAVQSIAGNPVAFNSWFDALDYMKREIDKIDFDIALLGCGAYAFPLAAHIKRMGRKAVHMGGILQFLFGIKSVRYEENPLTSKYINENFVYPNENDKPQNASIVEGGCYWGK